MGSASIRMHSGFQEDMMEDFEKRGLIGMVQARAVAVWGRCS